MSEEKKFGVELVKRAIKFVYDATEEGIADFKDKKLSPGEIIGFGDNAYAGIVIGLKSNELWEEIKDIDTDEGIDLAVYVGELVKDATWEQVNSIIENAIEAIKAEIEVWNKNIVPIIETIKSLKK